jgi:hypothetical protein
MKKLSEMKIAKSAILSSIEAAAKGGRNVVGSGTTYYGPNAPSSIATYVDGFYWGQDPHQGSLFGDSWSIDKPLEMSKEGKFLINSKIAG